MLRVVQFNSVFNGGGMDNQTLELCRGLGRLGHTVALAIRAGSGWEALARSHGIRVFPLRDRCSHKLQRLPGLVRCVRGERAQILHAHAGRDYWPAIMAARLAGCGTRVVLTRHLMTRPTLVSRSLLLRSADLVAVSQAVRQVLERSLWGPKKRLHQIYGGVDMDAFQAVRDSAALAFRREQGWPDDAVVFGMVGLFGLPRGKGQREFIQAGSRLTAEFPNARFAVVGRGSMESLLRQEIERLGLAGVATIVPFTNEMPRVMAALDVLVHSATGAEALGLVILEALASGKPVIASRLDGVLETFIEREHGLLVPPREVAPLAEAMRTLLRDAALRARMGEAGARYVRNRFSNARQCAEYAELFRTICAP